MTPNRALEIIRSVWGSETVLSGREVNEISEVELPGETALGTLSRVAGVDLSRVKPFAMDSWLAVRNICARRELELVAESQRTVEPYDESDSALCETCGGEAILLGTLGKTSHYRCRLCGAEQSQSL